MVFLRSIFILLLTTWGGVSAAAQGQQEPTAVVRDYEAKIKYYRYSKPDSAVHYLL